MPVLETCNPEGPAGYAQFPRETGEQCNRIVAPLLQQIETVFAIGECRADDRLGATKFGDQKVLGSLPQLDRVTPSTCQSPARDP